MRRSLDRVQRDWTAWGRKDPLFAVLTEQGKKGNRWTASDFFATGETEVAEVLDRVDSLGLTVARGHALDFGCGVGRLTQALCNHFQACTGVDIAEPMIEHARRFNRFGDRCTYVVNNEPDLRIFADESFDFLYTNIVLQHLPAELSLGYVSEFVRVLRSGGVAVFNCPSSRQSSDGALVSLRRTAKEVVRTIANGAGARVGKIPFPRMEMHAVPPSEIEALVTGCGARLVDARKTVAWAVSGWESHSYTVVKG